MYEKRRQEIERQMRNLAAELRERCTEVAEKGARAKSCTPSGVLGDKAYRLDDLCREFDILTRYETGAGLDESTSDVFDDGPPVPEPDESNHISERLAKGLEVWQRFGEDMRLWTSDRNFDDVALAIDLLEEQLRAGDLDTATDTAEAVLDELENKVSRPHVRRYRRKMRYLLSVMAHGSL